MKIAIFHNSMDNIGGAEYVDLIMAKNLKADIFTTNIEKEKIAKLGFKTDNIFSIGNVSINAPFRQESIYHRFKEFNSNKIKNYDFYIIGGDWAMVSGKNNKPNLWYVYSPIREIYDLYEYTRKNSVRPYKRILFDFWVRRHRNLNKNNIKNIQQIVSISKNVQQRVKQYLDRDSEVIYPPTETSEFYYKQNGDYWLSVNRLISHKRIDLQIKAFQKLKNEKLIVVGSYEQSRHFKEYADYIKKIKPKNVEIVNWISNKQLKELYANCKGFLFTAYNEDYGMTPVEAMASGKPVIAPNEGGCKETIIHGKTGILINEINEDKIIDAIKEVGKNPEKYKNDCLKHSKNFDTSIFINKLKKEINIFND